MFATSLTVATLALPRSKSKEVSPDLLFSFYSRNALLTYRPTVVRTRLDPDGKLLPAKSLTVSVRCYESRLGRVGVLHSNILVEHSQTLWSKAADRDFTDVGDLEFPFRITIPADVAGVSTANFQDYKAIWRVEAGEC